MVTFDIFHRPYHCI